MAYNRIVIDFDSYLEPKEYSMFGKTQHDRAAEQAEFQFRQRALKSLMSMRNKQLRESLDHRIKRLELPGRLGRSSGVFSSCRFLGGNCRETCLE